MRAAIQRIPVALAIAALLLLAACARMPEVGRTPLKASSPAELRGYLLAHPPDVDQFRLRGPFAVTVKENYEIRLSTTELIETDLYLSGHKQQVPLVILLHGHESSKEAHAFQALHLASWGMHCLAVQLPNTGPWIANGKTLAKIVQFIHTWPEIVDNRIDVSHIILAGHSFGGEAAAIALAEGAPAAGGILLDPAVDAPGVPGYLQRIAAPVMVIGADEDVSAARHREYFYRFIRSGIAEISIRDAAHEDAQYPAEEGYGTEELQITFASALTAAAFSLSATGNFDYAWASYGGRQGGVRFFGARRK